MSRNNPETKQVNADSVVTQHIVEWPHPNGLILFPESMPPMTGPAGALAAGKISVRTKLAVGRIEAAQLMSVSIRTFDRWSAAGLVHPSGVGRRKIFAVTELLRFLKETAETVNV